MISIKNIVKKYNDKVVLNGFTYEFPDRGYVAIMGESGSGKTTLIKMLLGTEKPDQGEISINGKISAVFQEDRLLEGESAVDNVRMGVAKGSLKQCRKCKKLKTGGEVLCDCMLQNSVDAKDRPSPEKILEELGLGSEMEKKVADMSGGMKRRVAIARCLVRDADVYIMDEPIKGLDEDNRVMAFSVIKKYTVDRGRLLIVVTHDRNEAAGANDIIFLKKA